MSSPLVSLSVGALQVALWQNEFDNGDGSQRTSKSVSIRRSFWSRKDNQFVEQKITLNPSEIGCLIKLLSDMQNNIVEARVLNRVPAAEPEGEHPNETPF